MDVIKAKEILGIKGNFDENDLKIAWRNFSKLYHPDSQNLSDMVKFQEGNEAHTILKEYLNKKNFNANYVSRKLLSLNTFYIANFSNVNIPKLEIATIIEQDINNLKNKYLDEYNNLKLNNANSFEQDYNNLTNQINQKITAFLNDLFHEMDNKFINDQELKNIAQNTKEAMKSQNNVYSIYDLYDRYIKQVEKYISNTPLTSEYAKARSNQMIEKYISTKAFFNNSAYNKILTLINRIYLELPLKFEQYNDIIQYEKVIQQADQKIEKLVIEYRNELLNELKDLKLSEKFPHTDVIINEAKINISEQLDIVKIYKFYNETAKKIENSIKSKIKEQLEYVILPFKNDPNYVNCQQVIERKLINQINNNYNLAKIGKLDDKYIENFQKSLYQIFQDYQALVNKKQELLGDLEPFISQPEVINIINQLNNAKEYDDIEKVNIKAFEAVEKLTRNNKSKQIAATQNELFDKLSNKSKTSSPKEMQECLQTLNEALTLLDNYSKDQINVDLNIIRQIDFKNSIEDLKKVKDATQIKKQQDVYDDELMIDIVRRTTRK